MACNVTFFHSDLVWIIGFINTASFYLLALMIIFFFFWLFAKPKFALISLIGLVLAFNKIKNIIPYRLSSSFTKQKPANSIRVMSWNVASFDVLNYSRTHNTKVFHKMFDLVNEYNPDIACFQEMVSGDTVISSERQEIKRFAAGLHFPYYSFSYLLREDWFSVCDLHYGTVIFSKYPIVNKETISHEPNDYNSTFQFADIAVNTDTIRVFNYHLESLRFIKKHYDYIRENIEKEASDMQTSKSIYYKMRHGFDRRKYQAEWIKEAMNKSLYPVIGCGDLNDVPNSFAYQTIGEGMQNAFVEKGSGIGRTFSGISPTLRIDNIFLDKKFEIKQYTRVKKLLSDHFPIISDITLKAEQ